MRSEYSRKVQGFIDSLTDDDVVSLKHSRVGPMGRNRSREKVGVLFRVAFGFRFRL